MNQLRFKLNDRVVGKKGVEYIGGKVGTVVKVSYPSGYDYGIQFDERIECGHELGDDTKYKRRHCRWANDIDLEPAPYFADARVGDSVHDWVKGDGLILCFDTGAEYPLHVKFNGLPVETFTLGGACTEGGNQTLFYSKPVFKLPPPPKRKIKKVIEGWIMINPYSLRKSKEEAESFALAGTVGEAHFIRHEYEGAEE